MKELNLPPFKYKIDKLENNTMIFDSIRKKFVILTPEEWVRQHFVNYLISYLSYPKALIKIEFRIKYNTLYKRTDILIFNSSGNPVITIECKSTKIKLSQKVIEQISVYNKVIKSPYCIVTNGIEHICWHYNDSEKYKFLKAIPNYKNLITDYK